MFKRLSTFFTFSFFALLLNAASLSWDQTEARIELKPDEEEARATFTVTNHGKEAVRIARIKTSCGCTGSIVDRKIIHPGESSEIVGTFHKGKRQGLNHNKLEVYLDSEPDPVATLHMIVQIPTLVEAQPQIIYWNPSTSNTERRVRLTLDKRYVDEITSIDYNPEKVTVIEEADPQGKADLVLRIFPNSFDSVIRETIQISARKTDGMVGYTRVHVFVQP
jgi:hypothetical protein